MYDILKNILLSSIFVLIIYFGFMHNVEILQILIGVLWAAALVVILLGIDLLYGNYEEAIKYKTTLKNRYRPHSFILSLIVIPVTCWILYTSSSYNFLASYIILIGLSSIIRYKTYTLLKTK